MIDTRVLTRIKTTLQHEHNRGGDADVMKDIEQEIQTLTETINLVHALKDKERAEIIIGVILS